MTHSAYPGRLGIIQRVLPIYRAPLFDALSAACRDGAAVFAGQPRPGEAIATIDHLQTAHYAPARNIHLLTGPLYLCWQGGLRAWLNDWLPNALIVEANPRYLSTPGAMGWMRRAGGPVLGWGLGVPPPDGFLAPLRRAARLGFLRRFDGLIAYSMRGADQYAALGFPHDRIFVAPNAMAPRPKQPMPVRPVTFGERPVLLYVGRLQARKRIDSLLHVCAALPEKSRPRVVIVGDGPERARLESLARGEYPLAEFAGAKYLDELIPYFSAADVFVLPGTGGLAVQEAMSYGLPVIVARGDGTQDDLVRPENGWQIPPDDDPALAGALREALADVPRLRAMGAESYRIVSEEINLEKMVNVFVGALNNIK